MWKTLGRIALVLGLGTLLVTKLIHNVIVEYYSPSFMSRSTDEARDRGVLLAQPPIKRPSIRWHNAEYLIREAWVEQTSQIKYDLIFFRRVIPTGYRLLLKIEPAKKLSSGEFGQFLPHDEAVICNGSIWLTGSSGAFHYSEFSSPIPTSIDCVVKKYR